MRIDEIYLSVQGEGPRVGQPTVFIRTGGCNLRCPGWPCDTQHAIDPQFRKEWMTMAPAEVFVKAFEVSAGNRVNFCLTGGEPFLQTNDELQDLVVRLDPHLVECFSNGTIPYPAWAPKHIRFIMDWKLKGSGEDPFNEIRVKNLTALAMSREEHAIKFVCKDLQDLDQAEFLWSEYLLYPGMHNIEVFYGVAWGTISNEDLIAEVLRRKLPWRLNVQMHNHIWDRNKRGI